MAIDTLAWIVCGMIFLSLYVGYKAGQTMLYRFQCLDSKNPVFRLKRFTVVLFIICFIVPFFLHLILGGNRIVCLSYFAETIPLTYFIASIVIGNSLNKNHIDENEEKDKLAVLKTINTEKHLALIHIGRVIVGLYCSLAFCLTIFIAAMYCCFFLST